MRSAGIEPTTICLEGRCSIQLSYERKLSRGSYALNYARFGNEGKLIWRTWNTDKI